NGLRKSALIPLNHPYSNTSIFTYVNNANVEKIASSILSNNAATPKDNIVDWVFLELRNAIGSGTTVLETRTALIKRDGTIVDVDGLSPVTFNTIASGSYALVVRHRNHLPIMSSSLVPL